jgi:uncharacterized membrane protein
MILHPDMSDDVLSLSMFWAGLMMVFTPLIAAAVVIFIWRRGLRKAAASSNDSTHPSTP